MEKYKVSREVAINKDCKAVFSETKAGKVHVKIVTFGKDSVVLTDETLETLYETLEIYRADALSS